MLFIKDINNSKGTMDEFIVTIGTKNINKFISKLIKDKYYSKIVFKEVLNDLRNKNFQNIPLRTSLYKIIINKFGDYNNKQLVKLSRKIDSCEILHKLVKVYVIHNKESGGYNVCFKLNTKLSNKLILGSESHYDCVDQAEQCLFLIRYVIVQLFYKIIECNDINVNYNLIEKYYSESINSGLIHPSIMSCEFVINREYPEFCSHFSRIHCSNKKLMVKSKQKTLTNVFNNDKILVGKTFEDSSKRPYINTSYIESKGSLSLKILDSKAVTYTCYKYYNMPMQHRCIGKLSKKGIEIRITPDLTDMHKICVTMLIHSNLDFSRINLQQLSTNDMEYPKTNLFDCFEKILSPLQILAILLRTVFKSKSVSISNIIDNEVFAKNEFLKIYKNKRGYFNKCIAVTMLSNLHHKQISKILQETYSKQNYRQRKQIEDMIKEYRNIKKLYKPQDLLKMFLEEILENR